MVSQPPQRPRRPTQPNTQRLAPGAERLPRSAPNDQPLRPTNRLLESARNKRRAKERTSTDRAARGEMAAGQQPRSQSGNDRGSRGQSGNETPSRPQESGDNTPRIPPDDLHQIREGVRAIVEKARERERGGQGGTPKRPPSTDKGGSGSAHLEPSTGTSPMPETERPSNDGMAAEPTRDEPSGVVAPSPEIMGIATEIATADAEQASPAEPPASDVRPSLRNSAATIVTEVKQSVEARLHEPRDDASPRLVEVAERLRTEAATVAEQATTGLQSAAATIAEGDVAAIQADTGHFLRRYPVVALVLAFLLIWFLSRTFGGTRDAWR